MIIVQQAVVTPPDGGDGGSPYIPPSPIREPRLNLAVILTGVDGSSWDMYGGPVRLAKGVRWGIANPTHWTTEAPGVDGAQYQGFRTGPVDPFWPVVLMEDTSLGWRDTCQAFMAALDPSGEVTMTVLTPDGQARWRKARYVSGFDDAQDRDPLMMRYGTFGLEFLAVDPYWHTDQIAVPFVAVDPPAFFPGPPWHIGQSSVANGGAIVSVPGDVAPWPVWTASGPFTGFSAGVGDSVVTYEGSKAAGQQVVIDMRPGSRSVLNEAGGKEWLGLTAATFAELPVGQDVELAVDITGPGSGSSLLLSFLPNFRGPF